MLIIFVALTSGAIADDTNIPTEDVQEYILATSDFAKGMQTNINNYVTRDGINNASFRQKLDPIKRDILRRQIHSNFVFEDISTFDAENPIVEYLLRDLDGGKKLTAGDLVKKAPGPPGVDFAIKIKRKKKQYFSTTNTTTSSFFTSATTTTTTTTAAVIFFFQFAFTTTTHHLHLHQLTKLFHHILHYLHHLQVFVFRPNQHFHQIICSAPKHKH